jgi:hypothetical protein
MSFPGLMRPTESHEQRWKTSELCEAQYSFSGAGAGAAVGGRAEIVSAAAGSAGVDVGAAGATAADGVAGGGAGQADSSREQAASPSRIENASPSPCRFLIISPRFYQK